MLDYQLLTQSLIVAIVMIALGIVGLVTRRHFGVLCISAAVMLQGVAIALTSCATFYGNDDGNVFAALSTLITVAQSAFALAMLVAMARAGRSLDASNLCSLGAGHGSPEQSPVTVVLPESATLDSSTDLTARGSGH